MFFVESALFIGLLLMTIYTVSDLIASIQTAKNHFANSDKKAGI